MAGTNTAGISEFARLLSLEPFPLKPVLDAKDVVKTNNNVRIFHEELERYLKRLTGKFTEFGNQLNQYITNVITNVVVSGTLVHVVEKHYTYSSTPSTTTTVTVDSTIDWRKHLIVVGLRCFQSVGSNIQDDISASHQATATVNGATIAAAYPLQLTAVSVTNLNIAIKVSSTGVLQLIVVQSAAAGGAPIDVYAGALHAVPAAGSTGVIAIP
jgi:hypothetical protein